MNIGDTVMVKTGLIPEECYGNELFVEDMQMYVGQQSYVTGKTDTGWSLKLDGGEWTWSEEMLYILEESDPTPRSEILLRACYNLLKKQDNSGYTLDLLSTTVFYDEADCDGMCLMNDIETFLKCGM